MKQVSLLILISFSCFPIFAQFGSPVSIQPTFRGDDNERYVFVDVDGDGKEDMIIAGTTINWLKKGDADGEYYTMPPLSSSDYKPHYIWLEDLDGDQDKDLFFVAVSPFIYNTYRLYWMENLDDAPYFGPQQPLSDEFGSLSIDYFLFEDINGDGHKDIITSPDWSNSTNTTFLNFFDPSSPEPAFLGFENLIPNSLGLINFRRNAIIDFDQDGLMDLVSFSKYPFQGEDYFGLVWCPNTGDPNTPFTDAEAIFHDVYLNGFLWTDLNADEYPDLIIVNTSGQGKIHLNDQNNGLSFLNSFPSVPISSGLELRDIDGDDDLDLVRLKFNNYNDMGFYARYDHITQTFEAVQNFPPINVPGNLYSEPQPGGLYDFDSNGKLDLIINQHTPYQRDRIYWWKNQSNFGSFHQQDLLLFGDEDQSGIRFFDMDDDGDQDVYYTGQDYETILIECIEEGLSYRTPQIIASPILNCGGETPGLASWEPVDFDGDGDLDIVGGRQMTIVWLENTDGQGTFGNYQLIENFGPGCIDNWSLHMADMDLDGDLDFITRINEDDVYIFYKEDGLPAVGAPEFVHNQGFKLGRITTADIDMDGDIDIIGEQSGNGTSSVKISLNPGASGGDWQVVPLNLLTANLVYLEAIDLEGDEDLDILIAYDNGNVKTFINLLGNASEFEELNYQFDNYDSFVFEDLDLNGFPDLLVSGGHNVKYYRNLYGIGFDESNPVIIDANEGGRFEQLQDATGDGKLDIPLWFKGDYIWIESGMQYYPQLDEFSLVTGKVFYDANQNGSFDGDDFVLPNLKICIQPENTCFYSNAEGNYSFQVNADNHTIEIETSPDWDITTSPYPIEIPDIGGIYEGQNIGLYPNTFTHEANFEIATSPVNCSGSSTIWVDITNDGTDFFDGNFKIVLDPLVNYEEALPLPDSTLGDTLFFSFESLAPQQDLAFKVRAENPGFLNLGEIVTHTGTLSITDDQGNEYDQYDASTAEIVSCSFDPNDKLRSPLRTGVDENFILPTDTLVYTIRFQNVGNAPAHTVRITDQLDPNLDFSTFQPLGASHDYDLTLRPDGGVQFLFKAIFLPDSTSNEPESHGFAKFQIQMQPDLPEYTVIENKAEIYFDYNPPIITNLISDTLVFELPSTPCFETTELMIVENAELCPGETATIFMPGVSGLVDWYGLDEVGNSTFLGALDSVLVVEENSTYLSFYAEGELDNCTVLSDTLAITFQEFTAPVIEVPTNSFCEGDSVSLFMDPLGLAGWDWYLGDDLIPLPNAVVINANEAGPYTIQASYLGCPDYILTSLPVELQVYTFEAADIIFENDELSITNGTVVQWYLDDEPITDAVDPTYMPATSGWYTALILDENGCTGFTTPFEVSVIDRVNQVIKTESLMVWPNPVHEILYLKSEGAKIETLRIWKEDGKFETTMQKVNTTQLEVNTVQFPKGLLLLEVVFEDGTSQTTRIVKE